MNQLLKIVSFSLLILTSLSLPAFSADRIRVDHDEQTLAANIHIQSAGGRIAWKDILCGLARAKGFDDHALDGVLPNASFDLTSLASRLQIAAYNVVLDPNVRFEVSYNDGDPRDPQLAIRLNREALLASKRRMKAWLRDKAKSLLGGDDETRSERYGLKLDKEWKNKPVDKPIVVAVHGLNSDAREASWLLTTSRKDGFACGAFNYPNDQPIRESAKLLAAELSELKKEHPERHIALVTHSMGGLIARAVVEDETLDPKNVSRLIMIAPPNHGSLLAHFAFGLDVFEYTINPNRRSQSRKFYAAIEDGFAEAAVDLQPDSLFLRRLNSRPRNEKVAYSIILGTSGPLSTDDLSAMQKKVGSSESRWVKFFGPKLQPWLEDLGEVVDGQGDGAVALKRGRLDGVSDIQTMRFRHIDVLSDPKSDVLKKLHQEVLDRLNVKPVRN